MLIDRLDGKNDKVWWMLSTAVVIVVLILDSFFVEPNLHHPIHEDPIHKDKIEHEENTQSLKNTEQHEKATDSTREPQALHTEWVAVAMPPLPASSQSVVTRIAGQQAVDNEILSPSVVAKHDQTPIQTEQLKKASALNNDALAHNYMASISKLSKKGFQIRMPNSAYERKKIGKFLYQCVGVKLASIERTHGQSGLAYLAEQQHNPSNVLRKIQGYIFDNERDLRKIYVSKGDLVRVYPAWFDLALSRHIAQNLAGEPLTAFSAEYILDKGLLQLRAIWLNNKKLAQIWTLARAC
ncbi:hypothetical protein [Agaribacter flavus]|uniref:Uncharacterized protein n=1 Tax=Agaribacter flavus TaxID=1902781 RepID=A0ABV7FS97_9ALTE